MDPTRFDAVAKFVATTRSRRGLLKALAGATAGALALDGGGEVSANKGEPPTNRGHGHCGRPGAACNPDLGGDCCFGTCCNEYFDVSICCGPDEVCAVVGGITPSRVCCKPEAVCASDNPLLGTECCASDQFCDPITGCCAAGLAPFGGACAADADCCSGGCAQGTCCVPNGARIGDYAHCCSGLGADGHCAACLPVGSLVCTADADCCSGSCVDGACTGCDRGGVFCLSDDSCCSGVCVDNACAAEPHAVCQPAGGRCATSADCCTGATCREGRCSTLQPPPG